MELEKMKEKRIVYMVMGTDLYMYTHSWGSVDIVKNLSR